MDTVFFLASKVFWLAVQPGSWLFLLLLIGIRAFGSGRQKLGMTSLWLCLALVLILGTLPIGETLLRPLEGRFQAKPPLRGPFGIIVLGGGENGRSTGATGLPEVNDAADRFLAGIALAKMYPDAKLIFSGGSASVFGESVSGSVVAAQIFADAGIESERVVLEGGSRNTTENASLTLKLIDPSGTDEWVLVTSAFHMPRAVGTFCAAGWTGIVPYPVDFRGAGGGEFGWDLAGRLGTLNIAIKEWIGLVAYRVTGKTDMLLPSGCDQ